MYVCMYVCIYIYIYNINLPEPWPLTAAPPSAASSQALRPLPSALRAFLFSSGVQGCGV